MKQNAYSFQPQLKLDCYHVAKAPDLFVRKVSLIELMNKWKPYHQDQVLPEDDAYYVECHKGGYVNWRSAKVYTSNQLVGRNNVFVIKQQRR